MASLQSVLLAVLLALPVVSAAQNSATEEPSTTQRDSKGPAKGTSDLVLHLDVRRVPVDVVVTDVQGNPVRGLGKEDFTVTEGKKEQSILSFDYLDGSVIRYTPAKPPALPTNTHVNLPSEPERGPLYVLYYDMVNTPMEVQMSARNQLLDFVDHAAPGTRIALFVNAAGLHLIQGFTSDHALLHEAIVSKGPGPHLPSVFMYANNYGSRDAGAALSNLTFLAEYLSGIPGRKNLLWLSSIFPIPTGPTQAGNGPITGTVGTRTGAGPEMLDLSELLKEAMKKAYSAMMRSQVALYPVDLDGIDTNNSPGDSITKYEREDQIADTTGGRAYHGNNRLQVFLDKAIEDGESYYTLSYAPTDTNFDGSQRQIEVTLKQAKKRGYTLSYRTLYYAVSDDGVQNSHKNDPLQARFVAAKADDTLYANIEHGAPVLHDLLFSVHLAVVGQPVMATAEQMLQLEDSPAFFRTRHKDRPLKPLIPVKLQKYRIDFGVFDPQLKALAARGARPAKLEFASAAYDADGRLLNSALNQGVASSATEANAEPQHMFHAEQELEVPPGAASVRMAVRDMLNNRTGTLEVQLPLKQESITHSTDKVH